MSTEPTIRRMDLPAGLNRGDVWLHLEVDLVRDSTYGGKKARAILSTIIYNIDGDGKRLVAVDIDKKKFYARGGGYDKISNATMQAIEFVQNTALDAGVWLPLAARYINCMSWYNLAQYFKSMFEDSDVFVCTHERSNLCLTADCSYIFYPPRLGYYYAGVTGRQIQCLSESCSEDLIKHDNAVLKRYADKLKKEEQATTEK